MKADVQGALSDQGYTATRAGKLDNLDATISSRPSGSDYSAGRAAKLDQLDASITSRASGADYTSARAAKLDQLDAAISSRAAPGATMDLAAGAKTAIWNEAIPGTPAVGSFGERLKNNLNATIDSRASGADYTSARAAKLDQLDAAISSRAAPGAAMDLAAGAKTAIWNEAVPGTPSVGSFGERLKNNLDLQVSSRASPTDVDNKLGDRGVTSARMSKLDQIGLLYNSGSVAAAGNNAGLSVTLDTSGGVPSQGKSVVEVRYSAGGPATFYAEGSDDGTTWYQGDTFSEGTAASNKLVGYLNTHRYFRLRSPTTGIDLSFEVRALL